MKKLFVMFLCILMFSCFKTDIKQYETWNQDPATKVSGLQINAVQSQYNAHSGKKFLSKYDETMWAEIDKKIIILDKIGHGLPQDIMIDNHLQLLKKYN